MTLKDVLSVKLEKETEDFEELPQKQKEILDYEKLLLEKKKELEEMDRILIKKKRKILECDRFLLEKEKTEQFENTNGHHREVVVKQESFLEGDPLLEGTGEETYDCDPLLEETNYSDSILEEREDESNYSDPLVEESLEEEETNNCDPLIVSIEGEAETYDVDPLSERNAEDINASDPLMDETNYSDQLMEDETNESDKYIEEEDGGERFNYLIKDEIKENDVKMEICEDEGM